MAAFETSNTADDCYKVLEFSAGELWKCHNYSIRDDQQCELEALETQFKVRFSLLASNNTKLRVDLALSTATIVIDDSKEPECCELPLLRLEHEQHTTTTCSCKSGV